MKKNCSIILFLRISKLMHLFHFKVKSKIILPQPKLVEVSKQLSCLSLESFVLPSLITMKMVMLILELLVHTHQIGADK